ncbi:MAG TPA: YlxR family protein [Mycobacteriales bacterium]|nr:YlxR family protein [Mycobacteriales bacterium]
MTRSADPVRTCVGCRLRATASDLLRVVVVDGAVLPDPRGRASGRGAHLHPTTECLALAERRRAFPRAFRVPGPLSTGALLDYLTQHDRNEQSGTTP